MTAVRAGAVVRAWSRPTRRMLTVSALRVSGAAAGFAGAALVYRFALGRTDRPGLGAVVLATVVVAVSLHLLDRRFGRLADRLVFGERAEGQRAVRGLLHRMASTLPVDEVVPRLAEAAGRTIGGARAEVRVTMTDGQQWAQVWPPDALVGAAPLIVDVRHAGAAVGEIAVDARSAGAEERRLLAELAAPAGLALSTVRLTVELRRRIAELDRINTALRASSERMRTVRRGEQRRLAEEVHERVGRHLELAQRELADLGAGAGADPAARLARAAARCARALDELRGITRGIFPPLLAEAGLAVAVEGWLDRAEVHAPVTVAGDAAPLRAVPEVETCLYFCAVTALHALVAGGRSGLTVRVEQDGAAAQLSLRGRGDGALDPDALALVRDRIDAFDGQLQLTRSPDGIDQLVCRVPLAAPPEDGATAVGPDRAAATEDAAVLP